MPILLLAPQASGGGAASYNRRMIDALRAQGHAADLVCLHGRYPAARPDAADEALIASLPADACLVIDGIALGVHASVPRASAGLIHFPSALQNGQPALRAAELAALHALPVLIATSAPVAARVRQDYGVPAARIHTVLPGVDPLTRAHAAGPTCQLLSLGPLVPRRAHDMLLRALGRLIDLDWHLTLIGDHDRDPAHVAALHALAAALRLSARVSIRDPATAPPWETTDLLVLAHPVPGGIGALLQALQRGIPLVLATDEPAVDAPGAVIQCPPGDCATLSTVLRRLIFDTALRARTAEAAWQAGAALADWDRQAKLFQSILRPT